MRKYDYQCAYESESEYECGYSHCWGPLRQRVALPPTRYRNAANTQWTRMANCQTKCMSGYRRQCRGGAGEGGGGRVRGRRVLSNKYDGFPLNVNAISALFLAQFRI